MLHNYHENLKNKKTSAFWPGARNVHDRVWLSTITSLTYPFEPRPTIFNNVSVELDADKRSLQRITQRVSFFEIKLNNSGVKTKWSSVRLFRTKTVYTPNSIQKIGLVFFRRYPITNMMTNEF